MLFQVSFYFSCSKLKFLEIFIELISKGMEIKFLKINCIYSETRSNVSENSRQVNSTDSRTAIAEWKSISWQVYLLPESSQEHC